MKDTIFIKVLEYGEQVGIDGTTYQEFIKWARQENLIIPESGDPDEKLKTAALQNLFSECFQRSKAIQDSDKERTTPHTNVLKTEYYFRLVEHRALEESRKAAKSANRNAFSAIAISIIAMIICTVTVFVQLNSPISINKSDLQGLIESNTASKVKEVRLDRLQMTQILSAIEADQATAPQKKSATMPSNEVEHHELINRYFEENQ